MKLHPIDERAFERACAVLQRGFPRKRADFWLTGFERHRRTRRPGRWPYGYLLRDGARDAGVILTFESEREAPGGGRQAVVNLSSWYMDEASRWLAPMMLKSVVSAPDTTFTDMTSTPSVARINAVLGFRSWTEAVSGVFLPWAGARAGAGESGRLLTLDRAPHDALSPFERDLLEAHARMGCVSRVLVADGGWHPLIFMRSRRWGVPVARLIFAKDRRTVADNLPAIARSLMRDGLMLLLIDGRADLRLRGTLFHRRRVTQFKGQMDPASIDGAYSELVHLNLLV